MDTIDCTPHQFPDTVFLADDDPDDRHFFEAALKTINPSILLFEIKDGHGLLNLLHYLQPDLVFLDLSSR
jgi:response regulator RpfG family c-di-GMP phosphodiesterase